MLTKATILNWFLTVVAGSFVFAALEEGTNNLDQVFEFGVMSMAVSAVLGGATFLALLIAINAWIKYVPQLGKRLFYVHLVHLGSAVLTFGVMFLNAETKGDVDMILHVIAGYCPVAAILWLVASWRMLRSESASQIVALDHEV